MEAKLRSQATPSRDESREALQVLECARAVHRELGPGLEPLFYLRAMGLELQRLRLPYRRDAWVEVRFRQESLGRRQVALLLPALAVEVLSTPAIGQAEILKLRSTLGFAGLQVGVLLNFGGERLEVQRVEREPATLP